MKEIKKWLPVLWSLPLLIPSQMIAMIVTGFVGVLFGNTSSLFVIIISCFITGGIVALPSMYVVSENVEDKRTRIMLYIILVVGFGALVLYAFLKFNRR